jgi:hypothetical protein
MRSILLIVLAVVAGCSDGRPEPDEARAWFQSRYPGVRLSAMRTTEDEVVARSYEFRYRVPGRPGERTIEIQFMEDSTGRWRDRPAAPARLP